MKEIVLQLSIYSPFVLCLFSFLSLFFRYRKHGTDKLIMSIFMLSASLFYGLNILKDSGLFELFSWFYPFYFALLLAAFPQIFLYVCVITGRILKAGKVLPHFIPSILMLTAGSIIYFQLPLEQKLSLLSEKSRWSNNQDFMVLINIYFYKIFSYIFITQVLTYFVQSKIILHKNKKELRGIYTANSGFTINWIRLFLWCVLLWAFIGDFGTGLLFIKIPETSWSVYLANFIICLIILSIYLLSSMQEKLNAAECPASQTGKYQRHHPQILRQMLHDLFENKEIYLKKDLSIRDIMRETHSNRTYISNMINEEFGLNFNGFVNRFRVERAKKLLTDKNQMKTSLENIASMAGFNSLASFTRAFKKFEKTSPGKYQIISVSRQNR